MPSTLANWLTYLENKRNKLSSEQSFASVKLAAKQLRIKKPDCPVITVTGTNGKGSVVHYLEKLALDCQLNVGVITSPHLIKVNERIRYNGVPISDDELLEAFNHAETELGENVLNYFQFINLVGQLLLSTKPLDLLVIEAGIGGRFDVSNVMDNDLVVISNIDFDHCDLLGDTREKIAAEKAALIRNNKLVVVGDYDPPQSIAQAAAAKNAKVYYVGKEFSFEPQNDNWRYSLLNQSFSDLPYPNILLVNASVALTAFALLFPERLTLQLVKQSLLDFVVPGRCELVATKEHTWLFDVSHNLQSVENLSQVLGNLKPKYNNIFAIFSARQSKPIQQMIEVLSPFVDQWYLTEMKIPGAANLSELEQIFRQININCYHKEADFCNTYQQVIAKTHKQDLIVVFGSFILVGGIKGFLLG